MILLTKPASEDALAELHAIVTKELKERIWSGEATSADISNAIKFLKDNGINCDGSQDNDLLAIAEGVPAFVGPDDFNN